MNINIKLEGILSRIVENAVRKGLVKTKAEAVRLSVLELGKEYGLIEEPDVSEKTARELRKREKQKPVKAKSPEELFR